MIQLRPYQQNLVDSITDFFKTGGRHALCVAPTGAGKTVMFSYICQRAAAKGNKILILTDRAELLMQTGGTLSNFNLSPSFIQAGVKYINRKRNVYVAMAQTLRNRMNLTIWKSWIKNDIDLVIIDEAHKQDFSYIFESGLLENKFVLGFTATPKRTGKMRQLALDYEKILDSVTVQQLIELGYLVSDDYYGLDSPDLTGVEYNQMKGDYNESQMFSKYNTAKLYKGVVKNWLQIAPNSQTLVFCVNVEHAIKTTLEFQEQGIDARFIVSGVSMPKYPADSENEGVMARFEERMRVYDYYKKYFNMYSGERSYLFTKFKNKAFPVLVNAGIATTGYDNPGIETVIINRATMSETLWLQMIGRGSRIYPSKTSFNILDFGGNAQRLGHYTAPRLWNIWHESKQGKGVPPVKDCGLDSKGRQIVKDKKGCERMILASYKICPFCGFKYPDKKEAKEIELQTIIYANRKAIATKKINEMNDDELYAYFKAKKHKSAWLWRQLHFRGGVDLIQDFGRKHRWTKGTIQKAINYTENFNKL